MRLQVVADLTGSKHTGDSRIRGKGGQPPWPITTPTVEGLEIRTFGEECVADRLRDRRCFGAGG